MAWTDERMDDFAKHTDRRFDAVDQRFDEVDRRFDKIDERFEALGERLEAMQRLMFQSSVLVIVALIGLIATQV